MIIVCKVQKNISVVILEIISGRCRIEVHWREKTDLSPYILCLFRLGLAVGVLSLVLLASSKSFRAWVSAFASIGSEPALSAPFILCPNACARLPIERGGIVVSVGEAKSRLCVFSMLLGAVMGCCKVALPDSHIHFCKGPPARQIAANSNSVDDPTR